LKKIIIASNRKSVVNDNRVEIVQPSWFTIPFVRSITEKFSRLNSDMRISFYNTNKLREFIRVHKDSLPCSLQEVECCYIRSHIRVAIQVMWDTRKLLK